MSKTFGDSGSRRTRWMTNETDILIFSDFLVVVNKLNCW